MLDAFEPAMIARVPSKTAQPLSRRAPEARRRLVIDSARRLFLDKGFERTRLEDVAAAAGVSIGAIYRYHPNKLHLLAAVRDAYEARFLEVVDRDSLKRLSPKDRFRPMLNSLFETAAGDPDLVAMLDLPSQLIGHQGVAAPRRMHTLIAEMIEDGVRVGDFRPVPPVQAAVIAYGMVEGAMRHAFAPGQEGSAPLFAELLADAWTRWLASP